MKKIYLKALLVLIGVLITSFATQLWAANSSLYAGDRVYFDCTNWTNADARFKINIFGTNGQKAKDVEASKFSGNIYYIDLDGQYNGFQVLRMSADYSTQWGYADTKWCSDRGGNDVNMIVLGSSCSGEYINGAYWSTQSYTLTQNKTIYFDNHTTNWTTPHVRIGKNSWCDAFAMGKVNGTYNFWSYTKTDSDWSGYHAFAITDGAGWTRENNIFTSNDVNNRTYYWYENVSDHITIIAGSKGGTVTTPSPSVDWYNATKTAGHTTYSATISTPSNGTLTVYKYTGSDYASDKSSLMNFSAISTGATGLEPTHILKIVTSPSSYYELTNLSVTNATKIEEIADGVVTYYITGNPSISATFSLIEYDITYNLDGGTNDPGNPSKYTYETAEITLEDPSKVGYDFVNWYTNSEKTVEGNTIPYHSNGDKEFWAKWSENDYTVTVTAGEGGTVALSSMTAHKDTKETLPTATPYFGYYFTGWTVTSGSATRYSESSADAAQINGVSAEGVVVQANFARVYAFIEGRFHVTDAARSGSWTNTFTGTGETDKSYWANNSTLIPFEYDGVNHRFYLHTYATPADLTTKIGNIDPYFYIKLSKATSDVTTNYYSLYYSASVQTLDNNAGYAYKKALAEKIADSNNANLRFNATYNDGYVVLYFDGSDIWYELEQRLQYDGNGSDGGSTPSANNTYYLNGSTTSAATNTYTKDGYSFMGWNTQADGNGTSYAEGASITMSADVKLYAIWSENLCTVTIRTNDEEGGTITVGGAAFTWGNTATVGVTTTTDLSISVNEGYYFAGWTLSDGDFEVGDETEDGASTTLSGKGNILSSTGTLTANFEPLERIYFRNDASWEDVWVGFDATWSTKSAGDKGGVKGASVKGKTVAHMTNVSGNYWVVNVPRAFTKPGNKTNIAFFDTEAMKDYDEFYGNKGVYRSDYNKALNMYVPRQSDANNTTDYYSNGYWMNYGKEAGEGSGYTLKRWRQSTNNYRAIGELLTTSDPNIIKYRFRVDSLSSQTGRTYYDQYIIQSAGNIKYKASSTITISGRSNITVSEDNNNDSKFVLTPTRLGYYVITLDQSGDQMKMSVNYPLDVNDYILEHTYIVPKVTDGTDSTVYSHSDIIKYDSAANVTRYSMFLSNGKAGSTSTLKLRQCTNPATQAWSVGDADNLSSILTKLASDGNGVYQFDLSVDKTNNEVASVVDDSTRLYTGKYYIKTDTVSGGWINYKRNALAHNTLTFKASDPTTYDYYYCHYYYPQSSSANAARLKCVIANDYCNALSDTLNGDTYTDTRADGEAVVHTYQQNSQWRGTSVRFSYNSATNKLQRTYLAASLDNYYLDLDVKENDYVFKTNGTSDLYYATHNDTWATNCRFNDSLDWVYEMNVKVIPMGKAGVVAKYKSKTQQLLPKDYLLLGCGDGSTCTGKYLMNLVYDFKTNYLMASWIPDGAINEHLEKVDMLWERVADNSAQQITFGGSGSLEKVKVVGAIRFDYNTTHSGAIDFSTWNAESRPYLKYFVSFPFDVPVSSIFGLAEAELGRDYVIQKYNGAKRAKEGLFFGDGGNFWEDLTKDSVMHANEGYCIMFDNDYVRGDLGKWWTNKGAGSRVYLYFPAKDTIASITGSVETTDVAPHKCNINRWFYELDDELHLKKKYHSQTDSHWNLIGSPKFQDAYIDFYSEGTATQTDTVGLNLTSYYYMDFSDDNKWKIQAIDHNTCFKAMHSYWVQWTGKIQWTTSPVAPPASAPAKNKAQAKNSRLKLDLMYNGKATDWTYVNMVEGADEDFKLCEDMTKVYNRNSSHIYTFAGNYDVAYNKLPIGNRTVNVGVGIYRSGTYTFAMPDNFDGVVILVDNVTGTRTNLAAGNYEVYLDKGSYYSRFTLEIGVNNSPTDIDNVQSDEVHSTNVRKVVVDGLLYIEKDGKVFDPTGRRVK